jgi:hypothetical protein
VTAAAFSAGTQDFVFSAEFSAIQWLEQNGHDVSYIAEVDTSGSASLLLNYKILTSIGHDEYWDTVARANVEAARAHGVNLAFMSGNEVYWKTRWEPSIDGSNTPYRTLVCYKETRHNAPLDPLDASPTWTWTETWRDPRFSPPADGGRPENALTGTIFAHCSSVNQNKFASMDVASKPFDQASKSKNFQSGLNPREINPRGHSRIYPSCSTRA